MRKNELKISIVIPTRDSDDFLSKCLESIAGQTYGNREILVADGGNAKETKHIVEKYGGKWLHNKEKLAEPGVALGMKNATGDILMVLAVDNEYRDRKAIEKIIHTFKTSDVIAAFPKHESSKKDSLYTKYINTFSDPATHFLYGNASNGRTFHLLYNTIERSPLFDVYDFSSSNTKPVIAFAQGFTIRKEYIKSRKAEMDDIKPILELLESGKHIAFVHGVSLFHHTVRDTQQFFRKQQWGVRNMLQKKNYGLNLRKYTLTNWQIIKIYLYPFYAISFFLPLCVATYKYLQTKEKMWFFHPVISFVSALAIGFEYVTISLHKNTSFVRK